MKAAGTCAFFPASISALRLRDAPSEAAYLSTFAELVRHRQHTDTRSLPLPRRPGVKGWFAGKLRTALWRVLRYQHDRMSFRQNLVNSNFAMLLDLERQRRQEETSLLDARLAALEGALRHARETQERFAGRSAS